MNINIICVGKIKEKYFTDAISEYSKRLSRYCKLQIFELKDEMTPDGASEAIEEQIKQIEGERILSKIKPGTYTIALAIDGKTYSSPALAKHVSKLTVDGNSEINFIIGGSLGLHTSVLSAANEHLSFSEMTFPHQLMRVILLEQIYRAYRIMNNEPYHK